VESWSVVVLSQDTAAIRAITDVLREAGHEPVAVVTPGARAEAVANDVPEDADIVAPASAQQLAALIASYEPDLVICDAFPWLVPAEALAVPRLGAINMHPSLLPRWRGPVPVAWAIRAGDPELGVTIHRMDEHFDTGPILAQGSVPFGDEWSWQELTPKLDAVERELLPRALARITAGEEGDPQPEGDYPYAGWFEDDYVWVDWKRPAEEVLRQIRAWQFVGRTPRRRRGPLAEVDGKTARIRRASVDPDGSISILEAEAT
jgi:methionyl-tRNA formyltransferase